LVFTILVFSGLGNSSLIGSQFIMDLQHKLNFIPIGASLFISLHDALVFMCFPPLPSVQHTYMYMQQGTCTTYNVALLGWKDRCIVGAGIIRTTTFSMDSCLLRMQRISPDSASFVPRTSIKMHTPVYGR